MHISNPKKTSIGIKETTICCKGSLKNQLPSRHGHSWLNHVAASFTRSCSAMFKRRNWHSHREGWRHRRKLRRSSRNCSPLFVRVASPKAEVSCQHSEHFHCWVWYLNQNVSPLFAKSKSASRPSSTQQRSLRALMLKKHFKYRFSQVSWMGSVKFWHQTRNT